jgi:hypothetical protein
MTDEINIKYGKTYTPKARVSTDTEILGNYWRAWIEEDKYYYECDVGHFASKFVTVEILKSEFESLKSKQIDNKYLERKYFP